MRPSTIALGALRRRRQNATAPSTSSPPGLALTRRAFLGASAGTLAMAAVPSRGLALTFEVSSSLAIFRLGGIEAWRIDPERFAGRPRLHVTESPRRIQVRLTDARYPGTNVSADLDCVCRWTFAGWSLTLRLGAFVAEGKFESWLAREKPLTATTDPYGELLRDRHGDLALTSVAAQDLTFTPDWRLGFSGSPLHLSVCGRHQHCPVAHLDLLHSQAPSALALPEGKRSTFRVERSDAAWQLMPQVQDIDGAKLFTSGHLFDAADIEASESGSGRVQIAFSARSAGEGELTVHLNDRFESPDRSTVALALRDVDYTVVASDGRVDTALLADFSHTPQWIRTADAAIQVGDAGGVAAFEWIETEGGDPSLLCAPRLLASLVPLDGVLTEAMAPHAPLQIALAGDAPQGAANVLPCSNSNALELCLPNCCVAVTRPKDLLALCFEFRNLQIRKHPFRKATLERCTSEDAYVIVHFPPQHVAEEALPEDTTTAPPTDVRPVASRAARPSRLAFRLTPGTNEIDYTLDSLLSWRQFDAAVVPLERPWRQIHEPGPTETSIEFPYRIKLSPEEAAHWLHSATTVEHDGRVELWHTRLVVDGPAIPRVAAVWSPDYVPGTSAPPAPNNPFVMSLSNRDRHDIIVASHDATSCPEPIPAPLFMLSSLGAWSNLKGEWKEQTGRCFGNALEKWEHVATMGRDQRVIVATRGFLYPFGHRAVLIKETERRVHPVAAANGSVSFIAYLRIRLYIELREPVKDYTADPLLSFVEVEFLDKRSPLLDLVIVGNAPFPVGGVPKCATGTGSYLDEVFWPTVQKKPYRFRLRGIDKASNTIYFDAPVIFVQNHPQFLPEFRAAASCAYHDASNVPLRTSLLDGQKFGIAASLQKGDTEVNSLNVVFMGDDAATEEPAGFKPHIDTVTARVPALDHFVPGGGGPTTLKLRDPEATTSQLFAEVVGRSPDASFSSSSDRSGGVAAPSMNVTHLSRRFGPVGAPTIPSAPAVNPIESFKASNFFSGDANILGMIPLSAIVPDMSAASLDAVPAIRSLLTEWRDGPSQLTQTIAWSTSLNEFDVGSFFKFVPTGPLVLAGTFEAFLGSAIQPRFQMTGTLTNFVITLDFGVGVALHFNSLVFSASSDGTTDVKPDIDRVEFLGALKFIQELAEKFASPRGFNISLLPGAVMVQAPPINIGSLSVGAFALENLSITTWVSLPFTQSPVEFGFAVARPDKPFLVTVGVYSGGGHFAITLDSSGNGVRYLRGALEFGAQKEISFGSVAHGRLYVFGGLYYEQRGNEMHFRAYVRAGGEIEALGLISMGIELYLALDYVAPGDLYGTAQMTYSFSIGFVKKSFSITYQQRFAGSGSSTKQSRLQQPRRTGDPVLLGVTMDPASDPAPPPPSSERVCITDTLDAELWAVYWKAFAQ